MIVVFASVYLLVGLAIALLAFFPHLRLSVLRRSRVGLRALATRRRSGMERLASDAGRLCGQSRRSLGLAGRWLGRHRTLAAMAFLLASGPAMLALALRPHYALAGYEESVTTRDPVVASLLSGEHLVPPPPLPPALFVSRELELLRPALGNADRNWDLVDKEFRQRLLVVFQVMRGQGYEMALLEGYRSPERQDYLASLGRQVTNASAYQSYHQYGLAADCGFMLNGRLVIDERDPWTMRGYRLFGEAAESVGLSWGGRWKMMDFGHVELRRAPNLVRHAS